jgi:hypothetical protein
MSDPIGQGRRAAQQTRGHRLAPALDGRAGSIKLVVDVEDLLVPDVMRFEGFLELGAEGLGGFPFALVGAAESARVGTAEWPKIRHRWTAAGNATWLRAWSHRLIVRETDCDGDIVSCCGFATLAALTYPSSGSSPCPQPSPHRRVPA